MCRFAPLDLDDGLSADVSQGRMQNNPMHVSSASIIRAIMHKSQTLGADPVPYGRRRGFRRDGVDIDIPREMPSV